MIGFEAMSLGTSGLEFWFIHCGLIFYHYKMSFVMSTNVSCLKIYLSDNLAGKFDILWIMFIGLSLPLFYF